MVDSLYICLFSALSFSDIRHLQYFPRYIALPLCCSASRKKKFHEGKMFRLSSKRLYASIAGCTIQNGVNRVTFSLSNDRSATVCREWILDNDVRLRHPTGQKTASLYDLREFAAMKVGTTPEIQAVDFTSSPDHVVFSFEAMKSSEPQKVMVRKSDIVKYLFGKQRLPPFAPLRDVKNLHRISFSDYIDTASVVHAQGLIALARDGLIIVEQCPSDDQTVLQLARAIDREMPTLYDTTFKVVTAPSKGPKNNIAYCSAELDLHQDIAYYESMPGVQLLHCQKFHPSCTGGESTFLDVTYAAQLLQKEDASAFKILTEVPAAFMKDDWDRPVPAQYYYATPHIHVNDFGDVTKVFWAPAFEAPLPATPRMAEYYEARRSFAHIINRLKDSPLMIEFKLKESECVIFHQSRMLHGRRQFSEPEPCSRQLHGAYVHVDAFRNAVITRAMKLGIDVNHLPGFANQSFR